MKKRELEEFRRKIEKAIGQNGSFTHNIISMVLRSASQELGKEAANSLVREYRLAKLYGINEEK